MGSAGPDVDSRSPSVTRMRSIASLLLASLLLLPGVVLGAEPYPPYPPPPPPPRTAAPPPRYYPPVVAPPPPLSPAMRVLYAPFYAAGLVIRYGVYYLVVAPLEVFSRTISYGVQGGVEPSPPHPQQRQQQPQEESQ